MSTTLLPTVLQFSKILTTYLSHDFEKKSDLSDNLTSEQTFLSGKTKAVFYFSLISKRRFVKQIYLKKAVFLTYLPVILIVSSAA